MATSDAQKSEVHETTADASTSPTAAGDAATTRRAGHDKKPRRRPQRHPDPLTPGTVIVRDDTDEGGPLVVKSDDPVLNPPKTPKHPFPTERESEFDPPV